RDAGAVARAGLVSGVRWQEQGAVGRRPLTIYRKEKSPGGDEGRRLHPVGTLSSSATPRCKHVSSMSWRGVVRFIPSLTPARQRRRSCLERSLAQTSFQLGASAGASTREC